MNTEYNYQYIYSIADFSWICSTPYPLIINRESKAFISDIVDEQMIAGADKSSSPMNNMNCNKVEISEVEILPEVPENAIFFMSRYYCESEEGKLVYRCLGLEKTPFSEVLFKKNGDISCHFIKRGKQELCFSSTFLDTLNLDYMLISHSTMILHSCFINQNGQAILFTAPSGTGKSTQGDLWKKYRGADIINGDRSGIFRKNGKWIATGLPYAGSSEIYRNESAPIRAIVCLTQGPANMISKMSLLEAFRFIYPEIIVHHWEQDFVNKVTDMLLNLLADIPVYHLSCTPDVRAVEALENELRKE